MLLIIPAVLRRVHVPSVQPGEISLDAAQARHARDVLRLQSGATVEVFDDAGTVASGELVIEGATCSCASRRATSRAPRATR